MNINSNSSSSLSSSLSSSSSSDQHQEAWQPWWVGDRYSNLRREIQAMIKYQHWGGIACKLCDTQQERLEVLASSSTSLERRIDADGAVCCILEVMFDFLTTEPRLWRQLEMIQKKEKKRNKKKENNREKKNKEKENKEMKDSSSNSSRAKSLFITLVTTGGRDFVAKNDGRGRNLLFHACLHKSSVGLVTKLIEIGGRELVFSTDCNRCSPFQYACRHGATAEALSKLLEVGGRDLIPEKDVFGDNVLHFACDCNVPVEILITLIEMAGRELLVDRNVLGRTPLHSACDGILKRRGLSVKEYWDVFTQYGGAKVLTQIDNERRTPLHYFIETASSKYYNAQDRFIVDNVYQMINRGIQVQTGEQYEYSIGGLCNAQSNDAHEQAKMRETARSIVYYGHNWCRRDNWGTIVRPALKRVMALPNNQNLPILQAIIMDEAPTNIIEDAVNHFPRSVHTVDSSGRYPIDVAFHCWGLALYGGLDEIVKIFSSAYAQQQQHHHHHHQQQMTKMNLCAKYGLQWEKGMKNLLRKSNEDDIETRDEATGLYPCMLAALGRGYKYKYSYDVETIFHLIQKRPVVVRQYGNTNNE